MGECACLDGIADCYVRCGRLATALALLEHADRLRERIGDEIGRAQTKRSQAEVLLSVGDSDVGYAAAEEARALARKHGLERLEHAATVLSARALMMRGDAHSAEGLLDGVRRRTRDPFARMEAMVWGARARLDRALQATAPARERALRAAFARARVAAALGEEHGYLSGQALGMATAGLALLHLGEPGQALAWSQRAAELFDDRTATALPVEDVLGAYAQVLVANGDDEEAAAARARALAILEARSERLPPAALTRFWSLPGRRELRSCLSATPPPTHLPKRGAERD